MAHIMKPAISIVVAFLLASTAACSEKAEQDSLAVSAAPDLVGPAPTYAATTSGGETASLTSLHGEVVLLNVWATWCGPCRVEIPYFAELQAAEATKGLRVVGVSVDAAEDRQKVLDLAPTLGLTYDIWFDPDARISEILGGPSVPATLLIDRAGAIRWKHLGVVDNDTPGFRQALVDALAAS